MRNHINTHRIELTVETTTKVQELSAPQNIPGRHLLPDSAGGYSEIANDGKVNAKKN